MRGPPGSREASLHADAVGGARARAASHLALQVESVRGQHLDWLWGKPTSSASPHFARLSRYLGVSLEESQVGANELEAVERGGGGQRAEGP